jgi:hypothetical protein
MAGLVPAIHVFRFDHPEDVDARHEAGHDELRGFETWQISPPEW